MEHGFFHPSRGYWQTIGEPSEAILATYPEGTVEVSLKPSVDHEWNGSEWVHTPPDPAIAAATNRAAIPPLSFAQLLIGLVAMEWITEAEGLAWLKSEALPAEIETLIAGLPQEQQFATTARAMRMTVVERTDPLVDALAAVRGFSPEEIDQFFLAFGDHTQNRQK